MNPGKGLSIGSEESHIVSPTLVSDKFFIPVIIKPISPEEIFSTSLGLVVNTPTYSIVCWLLFDIILIFIPFFKLPSITLTKITTPR